MKVSPGNITISYSTLFYIYKIFGLAPFSYKSNNNISIKYRVIDYIIIGFWIIFYSFTLFVTTKQFFYEIYPVIDRIHIFLTIYYTTFYMKCFVYLISIITINKHNIPNILISIFELDTKLFEFNYKLEMYKKEGIKMVLQLFSIIFILICLFALVYFYCDDMAIKNEEAKILEFVSKTNSSLINMEFVHLKLILLSRYQHINSILQEEIKCNNGNSNNHYLHYNAVVPIPNISKPVSLASINVSAIRKLRLAHNQLWDILQAIKKHFQLYVFLEIFIIITDVVPSAHFLVQNFKDSSMKTKDLDINCYVTAIAVVIWIVIFLCLFLWMTLLSNKIEEEVKISLICVQKLMLFQNVGQGIMTELHRFSNQLSNMKIECNIFGILNLNLNFFCGLIGAIITYIVVLYQI
ncbi:hypothetical protein L9F63_027488 [Diploptera punctata]|uniref:Gustatory receptor n=1 Tax=Diploptera punctata TaxID=6984 RepID=A0AAD8A8V5_DIPPU|nr:hypothetical protein L9F63_027488 [Diploptera punctata]